MSTPTFEVKVCFDCKKVFQQKNANFCGLCGKPLNTGIVCEASTVGAANTSQGVN